MAEPTFTHPRAKEQGRALNEVVSSLLHGEQGALSKSLLVLFEGQLGHIRKRAEEHLTERLLPRLEKTGRWKEQYDQRLLTIRQQIGDKEIREVRQRVLLPVFSFLSEAKDAPRYRAEVMRRIGLVRERFDELALSVRHSLENMSDGVLGDRLSEARFLAFSQDLLMDLESRSRTMVVLPDHIRDTWCLARLHDAAVRPLPAMEEASRFVGLVADRLDTD